VNELHAALMSWAITLSGYPAPASMPEIVKLPNAGLVQKACGGRACKVLGWFPPGKTTYINDRLDPQRDLGASSIVVTRCATYSESRRNSTSLSEAARPPSPSNAMPTARSARFFLRYLVYQPVGAGMHAVG
jgi:hypothetical protein